MHQPACNTQPPADFAALFARSGMDDNTLAQRCGYRNLNKGRRRLRALADGDLRDYRHLREPLAKALNLTPEQLDAAADVLRAREREARRQAFVPHVRWITEHRIPTSITMAVMTGMPARRYFKTRSDQPLKMLAEAMANRPDEIPFFGKVTGFYVCYAFEHSIRYDRHGHAVSVHGELPPPAQAGGQLAALAHVLQSQQTD